MLQAVDHVQLAIPRGGEERARGFYRDLLGLPEKPKPAELAGRGGCWFENDVVKVHCGVEDPFHPARKAHIAFRVDDVENLAERARASGFETASDRPLPGHSRIFIFDPFGNRLEFLCPSPLAGEGGRRPDEGSSTISPPRDEGRGQTGATPHPSASLTPSPARGEG